MARTLLFYDLETSGVVPAYQRVMQFAAQRTDLDLKPLGPVHNLKVKLPEDVLPEPEAILVHGITPQTTLAEGITERDFAKFLSSEIFLPDTVAVGFNNVRFDDEFVRNVMWRSFHDPYEWHWQAGRSRWDILDLARMTRALRPEGMEWPLDSEGLPTNRLVALATANGVDMSRAHDAEADVTATLELARRLKSAQPKLFKFSFEHHSSKQAVAKIIGSSRPLSRMFVYTSGAYPSRFLKSTLATVMGPHPTDSNAVLVYDLRHDPKPFAGLSAKDLSGLLFLTREQRKDAAPLPVKKLALNRIPAVAPLNTLDEKAQRRISLDVETAQVNLKKVIAADGFYQRVAEAFELVERPPARQDPDGQLYEGFLNPKDKALVKQVAKATPAKLADWQPPFIDERLSPLYLRYKARNLPFTLSESEQAAWEGWRVQKLLKGPDKSLSLDRFAKRLETAAARSERPDSSFLLEELKLYAESIAPAQLFDA